MQQTSHRRADAPLRAVLVVLLLAGLGLWQAWQCSDGMAASPMIGMPTMSAATVALDSSPDAEVYYDELLTQVEETAATGRLYFGHDGMAQVRVLTWDGAGSPPDELLAFASTTASALVADEVMAGLRAPLLKKLDHQFRPARRSGLSTMLLLDQIPRPGIADTVWLATPHTVTSVVRAIFSEANALDVLDGVWLRRLSRPE